MMKLICRQKLSGRPRRQSADHFENGFNLLCGAPELVFELVVTMLCNEGQMIPKRCFRQFCKLSTNELAVEQVLQLQKQGVVGVLCADAGRIELCKRERATCQSSSSVSSFGKGALCEISSRLSGRKPSLSRQPISQRRRPESFSESGRQPACSRRWLESVFSAGVSHSSGSSPSAFQ